MAKLILYYVHPGHRHSQAGAAMWARSAGVETITRVDLYAEYPRFDINIDREQERLQAHDILVFQFPIYWYSTPSLLKEWQDLVLEHGFAYGSEGTALKGKAMQLAVTAAGPEDAYQPGGYQHYALRDFLRPLEQTARLCKMHFLAPYVLYASLKQTQAETVTPHVEGYAALLEGLRDGQIPLEDAAPDAVLTATNMPEAV